MRMPRSPRRRLIEIFPHVEDYDGIFRYLPSPYPWSDWLILSNALDYFYFWERSGDKTISPFLSRFLNDDGELTQARMQTIAEFISQRYYPLWGKLFATYNLTYNPIFNFSVTKSITETHNDTDNGTHTKGTTDTRTLNTSDARTIARDVGEQADRSAYNASTYSPVDKVTTDEDTTDNLLKTGTDTMAHTGADTDNVTNNGGYTISETRSGFNGNYLYQTAIKSDRELWQIDYFEKIFSDMDNLLTLPIYAADPHFRGYAVSRGYPYI